MASHLFLEKYAFPMQNNGRVRKVRRFRKAKERFIKAETRGAVRKMDGEGETRKGRERRGRRKT